MKAVKKFNRRMFYGSGVHLWNVKRELLMTKQLASIDNCSKQIVSFCLFKKSTPFELQLSHH